jgi:hypothetical protein
LNLDGANFVWQKQNKKLFLFRKWQLTSVKDSTNVLFAVQKFGYKVEDLQLKVFIENFSIKNLQLVEKFR